MSKEIKNIQKTGEIFEKIQEILENLDKNTNLDQLEENLKKLKDDLDDQK